VSPKERPVGRHPVRAKDSAHRDDHHRADAGEAQRGSGTLGPGAADVKVVHQEDDAPFERRRIVLHREASGVGSHVGRERVRPTVAAALQGTRCPHRSWQRTRDVTAESFDAGERGRSGADGRRNRNDEIDGATHKRLKVASGLDQELPAQRSHRGGTPPALVGDG
jgi:hypothetical protein